MIISFFHNAIHSLTKYNPIWVNREFAFKREIYEGVSASATSAGLEKYLSGIYLTGRATRMPRDNVIKKWRRKPRDLDISVWLDNVALIENGKDYLRKLDIMSNQLKSLNIAGINVEPIIWAGHPFFQSGAQNSTYYPIWVCNDAKTRYNAEAKKYHAIGETALSF